MVVVFCVGLGKEFGCHGNENKKFEQNFEEFFTISVPKNRAMHKGGGRKRVLSESPDLLSFSPLRSQICSSQDVKNQEVKVIFHLES